MTLFTDPIAAIEEAEFLARQGGVPFAVIVADGYPESIELEGMIVVPLLGTDPALVLEICWP